MLFKDFSARGRRAVFGGPGRAIFVRERCFFQAFTWAEAILGGLGWSWSLLGRSWGGLGSLLGALGSLLGALRSLMERHAKLIKKSMPKMTDLDPPKAPKMTPKSTPKGSQNRCKKRCEKNDIELT